MNEYAEGVDDARDVDIAEGQEVMPFYIILDQSGSMSADLGTLHSAVQEIVAELRADAATDDTALLGVISFGSTARVTIPLSRLSNIESVEPLTILGGTNFSSAWETYDRAVRADTAAIKAKNGSYHRPCVFFLTDGQPDHDDRGRFRDTFLRLQGAEANKAWPYVVAYGFRDADVEVLKSIAYPDFGEKRGEYFLFKNADIKAVIAQVKHLINQTVIRASAAAASSQPNLQAARPAPASDIAHGTVDATF